MTRAAGTERPNTRRTVATRNGPAPPPRSAPAQSGCARKAAMEEVSRSSRIPRQNGGPATQSAVIVDHAEAADQRNVCILDRASQCGARKLPNGVSHSEKSARSPRLPGGQLTARGVVGESPVNGERMVTHELRPLALGTEAQVFDLKQADHGVVIVSLQEVHILMSDAGPRKKLTAIQ